MYMILSIMVKEITFWNGNLIYVIINVSFTFDFKKLLENPAQICNRCSLEYFAMLSRFHSRGPTHDFGSVTRIAFKFKLTGFWINFFQKWFLCPLFCLFIHNSRSKHSHKRTSCTGITSLRLWRIIAFNFDCRVHLFVQLSIFLS